MTGPAHLELTPEERLLLTAEVRGAQAQARSASLQATFGDLLAAVETGSVPEPLLGALEAVLAVGLESGHIRRTHRPDGEQAALRVYARTPRARAARAQAEAVTEALAPLLGHPLHALHLHPTAPGALTLTLEAGSTTLRLRFDATGVRVAAVEVG